VERPAPPRKLLHLEALTEWLAQRTGLPYLHIDPFKIDFAAVTQGDVERLRAAL
jgi:general secretion pathway protein E